MIISAQSSSINPNLLKPDPQKRYDQDLARCSIRKLKCPCCGTVGKMSRHGSYDRYIRIDQHSQPVALKVVVFRCGCPTCKHPNHAYLPLWICPFCLFTYTFLTSILGFFYGEGSEKIQTTAKKFSLSRSTVRILVKHFNKEEWAVLQTEIARQERLKPKKVIQRLSRFIEDLEQFIIDFIHVHSKSFFTRHFPLDSYWSFLYYGLWVI